MIKAFKLYCIHEDKDIIISEQERKARSKNRQKQIKYNKNNQNPFKGKHHSIETKKIMSEKAKNRKSNNAQALLMKDKYGNIVREFSSKKEALNFLNISQYTTLTKAIEKHKIYKNYYWEKKK